MRAIVVFSLILIVVPALADTPTPNALICEIASGTEAAVRETEHQPVEPKAMSFVIAAIDYAQGTAQLIGAAGAVPLALIKGNSSVSFVEVTNYGNVTLTTVFPDPNSKTEFSVVHSRHMAGFAGAVVSQWLGHCQGRW
ncbi:hypothetical protein [Nisaea sp.]|uniref:hypothetical protein n=1 Tax=Nisaea sp. TaxID=2024842 RepID=UPI003299FE06